MSYLGVHATSSYTRLAPKGDGDAVGLGRIGGHETGPLSAWGTGVQAIYIWHEDHQVWLHLYSNPGCQAVIIFDTDYLQNRIFNTFITAEIVFLFT